MRLLLDTCTFLWILAEPDQLTARARAAFESADNTVFLSAASAWEISIKQSLGRLRLPADAIWWVPEQREAHGIFELPVSEGDALHQVRLPPIHRDPFDRMLVGQSIVRDLTIVTPDPLIAQYGCRVLW